MRGFSDDERAAIRQQLLAAGRELCLRFGPEKTNVAEITDEVGIAKGTFYQFFDSKAALYYELFVEERDAFLAAAEVELADVADAETGVVWLFDHYLSWIEESPLLQRLLADDAYKALFRDLPRDRLEREQQAALAELRPFFETWRESGELRDVEFEVFLGLLGSVALVTLHRDDFERAPGPDRYEEIRGVLVETVARGLTSE
jgi:AcrR family transcriptional regulator